MTWEWRGFVEKEPKLFKERFDELDPNPKGDKTEEDRYIWVPGIEKNVKFRKKSELKFKWLEAIDGDLEKWDEKKFTVPIEESEALDMLSEALLPAATKLFQQKASDSMDFVTVIERIEKAGCASVLVKKKREGRIWAGPNGKVKVELAHISAPKACISIGLETGEELSDKLDDAQAKADIRSAITHFGLEKLRVLNYVDAVAIWAEVQRHSPNSP
jgi:hypothetical protein